jgi:AsmA protein
MLKSPVVRWLLIGIGAVVLLLVIGAVIVYVRFDPQIIGPRIAAQIEQSTGRKATIGKISLSLFPEPTVSVAPVAIARAGGAAGDALRIEDLSVRVHAWPLLRGRLEFGAIALDRPVLAIARGRDGKWSFTDILERATSAPKAPAPTGGAPAGPSSSFTIGVERATVRGARIELVDEAVVPGTRSELTVGPVDATVSGWGMGGATSIDLSAKLGKSVLRAEAKLAGVGASQTLDLAVPPSRVEIADVVALFPWLGVARPPGLALAGAVTVEGKATMPLDKVEAVEFQGTATVEGASYRDATMKRPIEKIGGKVTVTGDRAQVEQFKAVVGDSDLAGRLDIRDFMKPRIGFDLASSRLDLNQLLEVFAGGGGPAAAPAPASSGAGTGTAAGATGEGLKNVLARGTLSVREMRYMDFDVRDVRGTLGLERAVMSLTGLKASLYGGKLHGDARADLSRSVPRLGFDVALEGVDVNGAATAYDKTFKDLLRGSLTGNLGLEAEGLDMKPILDSARGQAKVEIAKGALTSISVLKQLAVLLEAAGGKGVGKDETPFESLRGSFAIGGGKAVTNDLALSSADLDMTAQGAVGLDGALDLKAAPSFSVNATKGMVQKTPKIGDLVDSKGRLTLHLTVKGSLAAPSIMLDLSAQTRETREKLKNKAEDKAKEKLRDRLKGLLGK